MVQELSCWQTHKHTYTHPQRDTTEWKQLDRLTTLSLYAGGNAGKSV